MINLKRQLYAVPKFIKRLANLVDNDSYNILGFHAYIMSLQGYDVYSDEWYKDINNISNRLYHTDVDFYNIDYKTELLLTNLKIENTYQSFTLATHIIYTYEHFGNEPIKITENGISFYNSFDDTKELNEDNIAFCFKLVDNNNQNILSQISLGEIVRLYIDLHKYRINTNLLSITVTNGLVHSHGVNTLGNEDLYLNTAITKTLLNKNKSVFDSIVLSPLVTFDDQIVNTSPNKKQDGEITLYEDWNDNSDNKYKKDIS